MLKSAFSRLGILLPMQGVEPKTYWISPLASIRCKRVWRSVQVILPQCTFRYVLKETHSTRNPSTSRWSLYIQNLDLEKTSSRGICYVTTFKKGGIKSE